MPSHKQYLSILLLCVTLCLVLVASINYTIDPAGVYHNSIKSNNTTLTYVSKLINSQYGLIQPQNSWKEREIKRSLANQSEGVDCAIIGSSHVMQIRSYGKNRSLTTLCGSLINLGVSGGTLEDYLALSFELTKTAQTTETIVFGIDPWSLNFQNDPRWQEYKDSYNSMAMRLKNDRIRIFINNVYLKWKLFINLINFEYFLQSIQANDTPDASTNKSDKFSTSFKEAPSFDLSKGIEYPVTLPDGSHVYSKKYILENTSPNIPIGGINYKIKQGSQISEDAIKLFSLLLEKLNDNGVNSALIMTPYHHNVWKDKDSITTKALIEVESRIKKLGRDLDIKVLGSYNPKNIGCTPDEFYDHMHAKDSCLSKIKN